MASIQITTRSGVLKVADALVGISLMQAIRNAGIDEVLALCGGSCSCATCHVYVDATGSMSLPPMSADENDLLEASAYRLATSRLACQLAMREELDGLALTIAPED